MSDLDFRLHFSFTYSRRAAGSIKYNTHYVDICRSFQKDSWLNLVLLRLLRLLLLLLLVPTARLRLLYSYGLLDNSTSLLSNLAWLAGLAG